MQWASRDGVGRIAVRSSEFNAINNALHAGSQPSDATAGKW
ncbi:hypothetical protein ACWEPL_45195 [Nonomuraea sp. NPDC004186]